MPVSDGLMTKIQLGQRPSGCRETEGWALPPAETTAWKKGQVVYLVPETDLAAGGAQELLNASKQVSDAFNAAK